MNLRSGSHEGARLMMLLEAEPPSILLTSDHFETVLADPCFLEAKAPDPVIQKVVVRARTAKSRERTAASHSAFRLVESAHEKVTDAEMLEMALCSVIPLRRLALVIRALLSRFNCFAGVVCASLDDLREIDGLGEGGVAAIKTIQAAAVRLARAEVIDRPILGNWERVIDYLTIAVAREASEHLRVLYLDAQNRVIGEELQSKGTVGGVKLQTRELVQRVLKMNATAVILVHNHPSGNPTPSELDVELTHALRFALRLISVELYDHVIIGKEGHYSFRRECIL